MTGRLVLPYAYQFHACMLRDKSLEYSPPYNRSFVHLLPLISGSTIQKSLCFKGCSVHQLTFVKYFSLDQLLFLLAHFAAIFAQKTREPLLCKSAKTLTAKQAQPPYGNETDYITKHLKSRSPQERLWPKTTKWK